MNVFGVSVMYKTQLYHNHIECINVMYLVYDVSNRLKLGVVNRATSVPKSVLR